MHFVSGQLVILFICSVHIVSLCCLPTLTGCNFSQYIKNHHEDITVPPFTAVSSALRSGELDDFDSSLSGSNTGTGKNWTAIAQNVT